jgi:translation initiation factor 2 beta subunit (eIF-2beta)/eIF-5
MPTFNKFDREFVEFLKKDKNIERNDVCVFLSGNGLPFLVEFLVKKMNTEGKYDECLLLKDKDIENLRSEEVFEYYLSKDDILAE